MSEVKEVQALIERFDNLRNSGVCSPTTRGLLDDAQNLIAALSTPPADDVREALTLIARDVHLFDAGQDAAITGLHAQRIADAIGARFEVRPRGTVTEQGEWACAKCGGSAFEHSLTTSTCVWEPRWRGTVADAEVEAAGRALYGISWGDEDLCDPFLVRAALEAARNA